MNTSDFENEALRQSPMGESPDANVSNTEEMKSGSIINDDDCGCVAEEITYTYSKYCWVTVSTSCLDGMVTTAEQVCCTRGDCSEPVRVPHYNQTCKQVCDIYNIPYRPRK